MVMTDGGFRAGPAVSYGSGFLPAIYQGTVVRAEGTPISNLTPANAGEQHTVLDTLNRWNGRFAAERPTTRASSRSSRTTNSPAAPQPAPSSPAFRAARLADGISNACAPRRSAPAPTGVTSWMPRKKIGLKWKLTTFTPDDAGFDQATAFLKSELDAGRPVVVDFKYIGPQYPGGSGGHTLSVCGYLAAEDLYILCNPAVATPGLQLITAADLKDFWRSDHYGKLSKGVLSRPAFVIERP